MIDIYKLHELKILLSEQEKTYLGVNQKIQNLRRTLESEIEKLAQCVEAQAQKHSLLYKAIEAIAQAIPSGQQPYSQPDTHPDTRETAQGERKACPCK